MSIWSILIVIVMLGLLVTIHELGHFWTACLLKIKVYEVSIFVGPRLFHWKRKGVEYSIRAVPLGAYVRFTDIDEEGKPVESDAPDLLINNPRWKRLVVAIAGPLMNAVLGVLIFGVLYCTVGFTSLDAGYAPEGSQLYSTSYTPGDTIVAVNGNHVFTYLDYYYEAETATPESRDMTVTFRSRASGEHYDVVLKPELKTRPMLGITTYMDTDNKYSGWEIVSVDENQNNGKPVLKVGDYLVAVDGKNVSDDDFDEFLDTLSDGDTMTLKYIRNGETFEDECIKTMITYANERGVSLIGYRVDSLPSFFRAFSYAFKMPATIVNVSVKSIGDVFQGDEEVYNMVSGPIGVTTVVSDVVDDVDDSVFQKVYSIVVMSGFISIGLMFTNMLPIPGLDGIQSLLIIVEMIIGRRLSKKTESVINGIGFFMLIALVLFAFASDIIRYIVE